MTAEPAPGWPSHPYPSHFIKLRVKPRRSGRGGRAADASASVALGRCLLTPCGDPLIDARLLTSAGPCGSALTGLVTGALRRRSPRRCDKPAPIPLARDGGQDLRRFSLRQHDQNLAEQRTEEAFTGASERPVCHVAPALLGNEVRIKASEVLGLVNLAWVLSVPSPTL